MKLVLGNFAHLLFFCFLVLSSTRSFSAETKDLTAFSSNNKNNTENLTEQYFPAPANKLAGNLTENTHSEQAVSIASALVDKSSSNPNKNEEETPSIPYTEQSDSTNAPVIPLIKEEETYNFFENTQNQEWEEVQETIDFFSEKEAEELTSQTTEQPNNENAIEAATNEQAKPRIIWEEEFSPEETAALQEAIEAYETTPEITWEEEFSPEETAALQEAIEAYETTPEIIWEEEITPAETKATQEVTEKAETEPEITWEEEITPAETKATQEVTEKAETEPEITWEEEITPAETKATQEVTEKAETEPEITWEEEITPAETKATQEVTEKTETEPEITWEEEITPTETKATQEVTEKTETEPEITWEEEITPAETKTTQEVTEKTETEPEITWEEEVTPTETKATQEVTEKAENIENEVEPISNLSADKPEQKTASSQTTKEIIEAAKEEANDDSDLSFNKENKDLSPGQEALKDIYNVGGAAKHEQTANNESIMPKPEEDPSVRPATRFSEEQASQTTPSNNIPPPPPPSKDNASRCQTPDEDKEGPSYKEIVLQETIDSLERKVIILEREKEALRSRLLNCEGNDIESLIMKADHIYKKDVK